MNSKALDGYWSEISSNWQKASHGKPDAVHAVRVNSRRLVAALEILEKISRDPSIPRLRRRFRKLIRELGRLRDVQVQISLTETLEHPAALRKFRRDLRRREQDEVERARHVLDRSALKKLSKEWAGAGIESIVEKQRKAAVQKRVRKLLRARSGRLRAAYREMDAGDMETVHALRIAIKKLRYMRENFEALLGIRSRLKTSDLQRRQTQLGAIRDLELVRTAMMHRPDSKRLRPATGTLRARVRAGLRALEEEWPRAVRPAATATIS